MGKKESKNRYAAVLVAVIMMVSLAACGEEKASAVSVGSSPAADEAAAELVTTEPELAAEQAAETSGEEPAAEEPVPEVVEEPVAEEPVVASNPNIIKGFDFTPFNVDGANLYQTFNEIDYDGLVYAVFNPQKDKIVDALLDGDTYIYKVSGEEVFCLRAPKRIIELYRSGLEGALIVGGTCDIGLNISPYEASSYEDQDLVFNFVYEDGTTDSITIHLIFEE